MLIFVCTEVDPGAVTLAGEQAWEISSPAEFFLKIPVIS